jgi:DNA-binding response OmpR family regulator
MNSILLVDDETVISAEFARTLKGLGFEVAVAPDVESGLSCAESARFDAILVEFNLRSERRALPRAGNGLQLVRQLRASDIIAPVLMFTAMEGELYEATSFNAGADDFIQKTTSIPSLVSRLRAHIRRYQLSFCERTDRDKVSM